MVIQIMNTYKINEVWCDCQGDNYLNKSKWHGCKKQKVTSASNYEQYPYCLVNYKSSQRDTLWKNSSKKTLSQIPNKKENQIRPTEINDNH